MLEQAHIAWYWEDLFRAELVAREKITEALSRAKNALCGDCEYCHITKRHARVLEQTCNELHALIESLQSGVRSSHVFPKVMYHDLNLYRGFIPDTGEYIPLHKIDHSDYRKSYAEEYGEERAYRMINIHGRGVKTHVLFCDRKSAPNAAQYAMLRELMIDAEGALSFHFEFDTNHPIAR